MHPDFQNEAIASADVTFTFEESRCVARRLSTAGAVDDAEMMCNRSLATVSEDLNTVFNLARRWRRVLTYRSKCEFADVVVDIASQTDAI